MSWKTKVLFLYVLAFHSGCHHIRTEKAETPPTCSVVDFRGEIVALEQPAKRAVCLIESTLSGIYMLGAGEQVIGISTNVYEIKLFDYYAQIDNRIAEKQLPAPGNWDLVSMEQVVALRPDVVFIWSSQTETIARLETFGIPVYGVMLKSFDDVVKEIRDLGILFGKQERAQTLIDLTMHELNELQKAPVSPSKTAYFSWPQGINHTSGIKSTVNDLFNYAGVSNVCALPDEHISVNIEQLLMWNPELIVLWPRIGNGVDEFLENKQLQPITAISKEQVFELPDPFLCDLWTLKFVYATYLVNEWAYPEAEKLSPEVYKNFLLKSFYGDKFQGNENQ